MFAHLALLRAPALATGVDPVAGDIHRDGRNHAGAAMVWKRTCPATAFQSVRLPMREKAVVAFSQSIQLGISWPARHDSCCATHHVGFAAEGVPFKLTNNS